MNETLATVTDLAEYAAIKRLRQEEERTSVEVRAFLIRQALRGAQLPEETQL
jgi:hypothetical protein